MITTIFARGISELITLICLLFIFFLPGQFGFYSAASDILPALDLILIFYSLTHLRLNSWQIMIIGLVQDVPYGLPVGCSSAILLSTTYIYNYYYDRLPQGHYLLNFTLFCWFALSFILLKICLLYFIYGAPVQFATSMYFYYFITVFTYPIMRYILARILPPAARGQDA